MRETNENKRELLLETLQFLIKERNMALFQLNDIRKQRKLITAKEVRARRKVFNLKCRLTREIDANIDLLTPQEKRDIFGDNPDS